MIEINLRISNIPDTPLPEKSYAFTLADDFLPPATLHNLTDIELKNHPELWPFDVFRKPRKTDNIPATVTTYKKGSFTQSTPWLEYWANNCALAWFDVWNYNELRNTQNWDTFESAWLSLTKGTRVITNGKGWDFGYYDPVSDQNAGSEPMGIDALLMERNVVELKSTRLEKYGGILGYLFVGFDGTATPPNIQEVNYRTHPQYFHKANIMMGRDYIGVNLGINPFPQGWQFDAHSPMPVICLPDDKLPGGVNLVPENRVHLTDGEVTLIDYVPNPYNPERYLDSQNLMGKITRRNL